MPSGLPNPCSKLTRREALVLGAAAGVTATVGVAPDALAVSAVGGTGSGPAYLRRSGYVERVGERFFVGGHVLTLDAVDDVAGARSDEDLRGHDAAFSLRFTGPADVLPSALYEVHNDMLGPFPLFLGPVEDVRGTAQAYNAVIDRTIRVRLAPAAPDAGLKAPTPAPAPAKPAAAKKDDPAPSEPTPRDLEIVEERERAVLVARVLRRRRARRTRNRMRRAHANRMTFARRQRKAAKTIRRRWLARHAP